jgi:hypothetical protein
MDLYKYYENKNTIKVTGKDGSVIQGEVTYFTNKLDTNEELYDELTIKTDEFPYVTFNESEIQTIEVVE